MSDIRIDAPGAGEWIMERVDGSYTPGRDHSFASFRDGEILGGFVLCEYYGASMSIHMAGDDPQWCSRELLWMAFHYAFVQLGCRKLFAPVKSTNYHAIELNLRAGWHLEAVIKDVYIDAHMMVLSMTKEACPWLDYAPTQWRPADEEAA